MSTLYDVLVVGAGPAGVAAAIEAASGGANVLLVEQRPAPGGAIHRAAYDGTPTAIGMPARHKKNWARLKAALEAQSDRIRLLTEAVFLGIDGRGICLVDHRSAGRVKLIRSKAIIFATGATERVPHVPGWNLPGVVTAGGLQVQMKESGEAPRGRILIAASGPLPVALGAQLATLGNPPLAIFEPARPFRNLCANPAALFGLAAGPKQLAEGLRYFGILRKAGVPYRTGTRVRSVRQGSDHLAVTLTDHRERDTEYAVDILVLHDGLASNDHGIPTSDAHGIIVSRTGDCNRVLGADAAITEGQLAARAVMEKLSGIRRTQSAAPFNLAQVFQRSLWKLFEKPPLEIAEDTIVCRCERVSRRELIVLNLQSPRELRLVGRIGMGLCQGRFCAHAVSPAADDADAGFTSSAIDDTSLRWPIRPVSVKALAAAEDL